MTAIGLLMFMIGALIVNMFGAGPFEKHKIGDYLGGAIAFIGLGMSIAGFLIWLWYVMP